MTRPTDKNRRNLYIKQEDYDYLGQIGNSYADGLRKAIEAHKVLDGNKPCTDHAKKLDELLERAAEVRYELR